MEVKPSKLNYRKYERELIQLFFTRDDYVQPNTKQYDDFWIFLERIQKSGRNLDEEGDGRIKSVISRYPKFIDVRKLRQERKPSSDRLRTQEVQYFRSAVCLYLDFLEKKTAKEAAKLAEDKKKLPIYEHRDDILCALKDHSVVLIAGDTGCGKSTQVPQYLLEDGFEQIACTQPRRIACIALAQRVSYETRNAFGEQVGYKIRFDSSRTRHTKILFLTEGLLLRQLITDPTLSSYNVVIIDECHERHLSCDFLVGVIKCLLIKRPDLKVILMSATINFELFSEYFGGCPIIKVAGRLFPIEIKYYPPRPEELGKSVKINPAPYLRLLQQIDDEFPSSERGDLLVFLSGINEIAMVADVLQVYAMQTKKWIILMLHSSLSIKDQDKVFDVPEEGVRKCILSTNIAETSVTIDGIRFVADSGKVKEMSFDSTVKMRRLQEFWVSKASADQRKGRAGRTGPGICYRLYSQRDFDSFAEHSTPEIQRVPIESTLLQMIAMGLPDVRKFPFIQPPPSESIEESIVVLQFKHAIDQDERITGLGKILANLPVDVNVGHILIMGCVLGIVEPILSLAAALSVQSPLNYFRDSDAVAASQRYSSKDGDPLFLLNLFNEWMMIKMGQHRDYTDSRKFCRRLGLEEQRFYEMVKLREQFKSLLQSAGLIPELDQEAIDTMTRAERMKRHGELKQLKELKRKHVEEESDSRRRRKLLKFKERDALINEDDGDGEDTEQVDIRDIDFRIKFDPHRAKALCASRRLTSADIISIKLILSEAFYPQFALPDENNQHRKTSDQYYHTKQKPFLTIHPTSTFTMNPEFLLIKKAALANPDKTSASEGQVSLDHHLIAYYSLLETNKAYICNCLRIPAVHILLLVSHKICTNFNLRRIAFDDWLEVKFHLESVDDQSPAQFARQSIKIRDNLEKLLTESLREGKMCSTAAASNSRLRDLRKDLAAYIDFKIPHTLKRLFNADIKTLYAEPSQTHEPRHDIIKILTSKHYSEDEKELQIRSYFTYNNLKDDGGPTSQTYLKTLWKCPACGETLALSVLERLEHESTCGKPPAAPSETSAEQPGPSSSTHNSIGDDLRSIPSIDYFCDECKKELSFTNRIEILKHKASHNVKS